MYDEQEIFAEEQDLRILKNIISDPGLAYEFLNSGGETFLMGDAKIFGEHFLSYLKDYHTIPTKRVLLDRIEDDGSKIKLEEIFSLIDETDSSPNEFRYDLEKIKNRYLDVKKDDIRQIVSQQNEGWFQQLKFQIQEVDAIRANKPNLLIQKSIKDHVKIFKKTYSQKLKDPNFGRGILTGYSLLDFAVNGMNPGEMLIVGGESGSGKSVLLNNLAIQMWMQKNTIDCSDFSTGYNVLYFSLEMPFEQCFMRTVASIGQIPFYGLRDATLNKLEIAQAEKVFKFLKNYSNHFEIVDIPRGCTTADIEKSFLDARNRFFPHVVVVDYLGLLRDPDINGDDWLRLGEITNRLREFCRTYNIVLLTAVQLNRVGKSVKDPSEIIGMHRIGRSNSIMDHANVGVQIEKRKDEKSLPDFKYHIIKNRNGENELSHFLIKNFRCSSLRDPEIPYTPVNEGFTEWEEESGNDDISKFLEKHHWAG